ncbi:MAG: hypothetical protein UIC64_09135 [Agathobacter sp.]|nr:hypothetical protein [Agathobacter sp.]
MDTLLTKKYPVSKEEFTDIVLEKTLPLQQAFMSNISDLLTEIKNITSEKRSVLLLGRNFYLDTVIKCVFPNLNGFEGEVVTDLYGFNSEDYFVGECFDGRIQYDIPTFTQLRSKKGVLTECFMEGCKFVCTCDDKRYSHYYELEVAYNPYDDSISMELDNPAIIIPVVNLEYSYVNELLVNYLVPLGMCLEGLSLEATNCLSDLIEICKKYPECLYITTGNQVAFGGGKSIVKEYGTDSDKSWMEKLHWELIDVLKQIYDIRNIGDVEMDTKEDLLNCEKIRADIDPYEERILTDPNRGHWDLWLGQDDSQYTVEVADELVARNPICDINENGVIAIDFGTKSTIVVYQSDIEHSLPMGIGDGNLSKQPTPKRYENPTVMHFVDLDSFLKDYDSRKGRPKTKWENLTISHTAMDQFSNSKSEEYYEYLHQIKQWAGQREKQFRVQSHDGQSYVLPAFLDLDESDWNPIEIYAYYIGLYINNMRKGHGIFLDYYLSFPVTYETKIREKIVRSFEKGLKKSLPSSILENEEIMKKFHVNGEISEPAAYAVCALQEYGFDPEDDEEIFYGIFDFGGGTTDFDFGLWKQSAKRRYDYTIENFGAGGDEYLGGANLLEMLAFDVFKENQELMREKGYTFTLAPKCTEFLGSDSLLADSQEAEKNMHNLMEKIRPYWENQAKETLEETNENGKVNSTIARIKQAVAIHPYADEVEKEIECVLSEQEAYEYSDEYVLERLSEIVTEYEISFNEESENRIDFVLTLFDKEGQDHPNEKLTFPKHKLETIIEDRIRDGVNNFFSALLLSYQNEKVKKPTTVNILLAGNSCKSPVVKKVFEEAIAEQERQIKERYNIKEEVGSMFEIFPPLGTEEAYKKMESRGLTPSRNDFEKPTGKTGVAFGLIQCRAGGTIERISNVGIEDEIPFQYFIGWRSRKKFVLFKDDSKLTKYRGKPDYNEWYKFIEADDSVFDLCYTTLPECVSGELMVDGNAAVKRLRCEIDVVDEDAFVYIRAVDPHTIEYVVAKDGNVDDSKLGNIVRKEL